MTAAEWEYVQEMELATNLATGEREPCVRLKYRRPGTRRWSRVLVFSEWTPTGLPVDVALLAIAKHEAGGR